MVGVGLRPDHVLHREPGVDEVPVAGHVHVLQVVQQRGALVPGHVRGPGHHVVALQRRDRDDRQVGDARAGRLVAPDEGTHTDTNAESIAYDVGIDGAGATAEEAAMHVIPDDEEF